MNPRYVAALAGALAGHAAILLLGSAPATAVEYGMERETPTLEVGLVAAAESPASEGDPLPPAPEPQAESLPPAKPPPDLDPEPIVEPEAAAGAEPSPSPSPVVARPASRPEPARPLRSGPPTRVSHASRGRVGPGLAEGRATDGGNALNRQPGYLSNPRPAYPVDSRRAGEEGAVYLTVQVDPSGRAAAVTLERSSGFPRLDRAAIEAVRRWRFRPALRAGVPVAASVTVPVRFELDGPRSAARPPRLP